MDVIQLLAQGYGSSPPPASPLLPVDKLWEYVISLRLVESLTFISFGVVWLFYGWRVFKILTTICFSLFGLFIGVYINRHLIEGDVVWLSILFMLLFGFGAVWFMKWSVSALGGAAGAVMASGVWMACGFNQNLVWAGAMVGFVGGAMLSFIVFKAAVMMFTCLGGSLLSVTGVLAIMYTYLDVGPRLQQLIFNHRWFLPFMIITPMIVGMIVQHRFMKGGEEPSM